MPEPISTTLGICWLSYATLNAYARQGSAVSAEASQTARQAYEILALAEDAQSLFGKKADMISSLQEMARECDAQVSEGDGAFVVDPTAMQNAADFLRALPEYLPSPEFAPEPDGSVELDWIQSRNRMFSLSIGVGRRLAFAWLDGADKGHGVAHFDGVKIPAIILSGIKSTLGQADAAVRVA